LRHSATETATSVEFEAVANRLQHGVRFGRAGIRTRDLPITRNACLPSTIEAAMNMTIFTSLYY